VRAERPRLPVAHRVDGRGVAVVHIGNEEEKQAALLAGMERDEDDGFPGWEAIYAWLEAHPERMTDGTP
jgi:hypothetical protein